MIRSIGTIPAIVVAVHLTVSAASPIQFVDVSVARGIQPYEMAWGMAGGVAAADFDGDGDIDLFAPTKTGQPHQLYRNLGGGVYEEIAASAGLDVLENGRVALWLDYDGDHLLDLFVGGDCNTLDPSCLMESTVWLYRQVSPAQFQDVSVAAGLVDYLSSGIAERSAMAAGDLNGDGWLDLVYGEWEFGAGRVYINDGDGSFTSIGESSGIAAAAWSHHQPILHDYDGDGDTDIFWAVDFYENQLWMNQGDHTFVDAAADAGVDNAWNEMGAAPGDYDNDGDLDLYVTNITSGPLHNLLYRNDSVGAALAFTDEAVPLGVGSGGWGWGATFFDADNDGWLDLAETNGYDSHFSNMPSRFWLSSGSAPVAYQEMSTDSGFDDTYWGSTLLAADLDRDGDQDLVQSCNPYDFTGPSLIRLMDNQQGAAAQANNYLVVKPRMTGANHWAVGAVVRVEAGTLNMMRLITAGTSYMSQEPHEAFFGLGGATLVDRVLVEWPDGGQTEMTDVTVNQVLTMQRDTDSDNDGLADGDDPDDDNDGVLDGADCFATNAAIFQAPGAVSDLALTHGGGTTTLDWSAPVVTGGSFLLYDTLVATAADDLTGAATCLETNHSDRSAEHTVDPDPGAVLYFLVRTENSCGANAGQGSLGARVALDCL